MIRRLVVLASLLVAAPGVAFAQDSGARVERKEKLEPKAAPKLTKAPAVLEAAPPVYPEAALAAGLTADVTVKIHIDATGAVSGVGKNPGAIALHVMPLADQASAMARVS